MTNILVQQFKLYDVSIVKRLINNKTTYWFKANDIAKILDIKKIRTSISEFDDDEKGVHSMGTMGGNQKVLILSSQGVYRLLYSSRKPIAKEFRKWVGNILDDIIFNDSNVFLKQELIKSKNLLDEKDAQLNRLHNIQIELLSYKKRVTKNEIVYIVSTKNYARQGIFKIGRTKTKMNLRSSSHNNTHIQGDKVIVLKEFKVNDSVLVERNIHTKLSGLLVDGEKEFFVCPFDLLVSIVDMIVNNDDLENKMINNIIDTVYKLKQLSFNANDWTLGIPKDAFEEKILIMSGDEKLVDLNVTNWTQEHKKEFIGKCLHEYVIQQNKVNQDYQIVWRMFQQFLIEQLSIPKSQFKATEWKNPIKEIVNNKIQLTIKWRS